MPGRASPPDRQSFLGTRDIAMQPSMSRISVHRALSRYRRMMCRAQHVSRVRCGSLLMGVVCCVSSFSCSPPARVRSGVQMAAAPCGTDEQDASTRSRMQSIADTAVHKLRQGLPHAAEAWPGFWRPGHQFALVPYDCGTLIVTFVESGHNVPGRPEPTHAPWHIATSRLARTADVGPSGFTLEFVVGRDTMVATAIVDSLWWGAATTDARSAWRHDPVASTLVHAAHEQFHRYQSRSFSPLRVRDTLSVAAPAKDGTVTPALRAQTLGEQLREERALLRSALDASDLGIRRQSIHSYYRLRARRLSAMSPGAALYELDAERFEGVAHLISYLTVAALLDRPQPYVVTLVSDDLDTPLSSAVHSDVQMEYARWHVYAAGAAKGLLLEVLGASWRDRVRNGESLDAVLCEVARVPRVDCFG